jgi:hypothetical protein
MANFDPLNTEWELYNIDEDPIQQVNVADQYPEKVKELEKLLLGRSRKVRCLSRRRLHGPHAAAGIQSAAGRKADTGS